MAKKYLVSTEKLGIQYITSLQQQQTECLLLNITALEYF